MQTRRRVNVEQVLHQDHLTIDTYENHHTVHKVAKETGCTQCARSCKRNDNNINYMYGATLYGLQTHNTVKAINRQEKANAGNVTQKYTYLSSKAHSYTHRHTHTANHTSTR